ncbi:MAG: pilus assembly protein PilM [Dehalococcoidia bacterium]|jgi:type IV pilus assembly protein PilM
MAKKITTLFIRDDAINLLVMRGERVEKWATMPLEPGLVSQGLIVDEVQVVEKLKELFKLQKLGMGRVVAGISGHNSVYRIITLPELPEAVLPEAVKREAKRVIPVPLEEVYLSYQPITTAAGETLVFLAAFPRNIADTLYQTLHKAGLQPYMMDLAPLALCRAANQPRSIIVNSRADHLDIMVIVDRVPQLIRRLSMPGETESLAERLDVVTEEIDRTIAFYNSSHGEEPLDAAVPMLVCGDLVRVPENWQALAEKSTHPVSVMPSPIESPEGFDANEFMVNIGLGLKELLPEKKENNFSLVNINTLPEVYRPKAVRLPSIIAPIAITIGLGILVYLGIMVANKSNRLGVLEDELAPLELLVEAENQQIATLEEEIALISPQVAAMEIAADIFDGTYNILLEARDKMNDDMSQIVSLQTGNLLTAVNHLGDMVMLSGFTTSESSIFSYARALRNSGRFSTVVITSVEAVEEDDAIVGLNFEFLLR